MVRWCVRKTVKREKIQDTLYGTVYREFTHKEKVLQYMDGEGNWRDVETVEENNDGA